MPTTWPLWGYSTWHQISLVRRYISDDFWTLLEQTLPVNQISPVGIGKSTDIKSLFLYTSSIMHHITHYSTVGMRDTNRSIDTKSFASGDSGWNLSAWKHQSNCDTPPSLPVTPGGIRSAEWDVDWVWISNVVPVLFCAPLMPRGALVFRMQFVKWYGGGCAWDGITLCSEIWVYLLT